MRLGSLSFEPIQNNAQLVAEVIQKQVESGSLGTGIFVTAIDPALADTESFCKTYGISQSIATNCIVVEAKRADKTWYAACLILANDMIDVNGKVRRHLEARKISFAPKDTALKLTGMEYGGITPLGLPVDWPILIDEVVVKNKQVVIGGGTRGSKILIAADTLASLPNTTVMDITK